MKALKLNKRSNAYRAGEARTRKRHHALTEWLSRLVRFLTPRRRNVVEMTSPRLGQLLDVSRELDCKQKLNPSCEVTKDGKHIWKHGHDFARAAKCRACDKWYDL